MLIFSSAVHAVPLSTFDSGTEAQRSHYVATTLQGIHAHYLGDEETKHIADCMTLLLNETTPGGSNELTVLITTELELVRILGSTDLPVNHIMAGVIEQNCND